MSNRWITVRVCDCAPDCGERIACQETGVGHLHCGVCPKHQQARHMCGCMALLHASVPGLTQTKPED